MKQKPQNYHNYRIIKILGIDIDFINLSKTLISVKNWVEYNEKHQITTPNPEQIVLAQKDYRLKKIINKSKLSICDGVGLLWAARLTSILHQSPFTNNHSPRLHRLSGTDLMLQLCKLAAQNGWRVFLLGGKKNTAKRAAQNLKKHLSTIHHSPFTNHHSLIIDYYHGSQNVVKETKAECKKVINRINKFQPHLLFVAFGAPTQEIWIAENLKSLNVNCAMGVGGAFDYFAKNVKRAPKCMQKIGLEWLWRLIHQPSRWKRQTQLLKFIYLFFKKEVLQIS